MVIEDPAVPSPPPNKEVKFSLSSQPAQNAQLPGNPLAPQKMPSPSLLPSSLPPPPKYMMNTANMYCLPNPYQYHIYEFAMPGLRGQEEKPVTGRYEYGYENLMFPVPLRPEVPGSSQPAEDKKEVVPGTLQNSNEEQYKKVQMAYMEKEHAIRASQNYGFTNNGQAPLGFPNGRTVPYFSNTPGKQVTCSNKGECKGGERIFFRVEVDCEYYASAYRLC